MRQPPFAGLDGSQKNHNWGIQHTDSYAWGRLPVLTLSDWFLECASARLQYDPFGHRLYRRCSENGSEGRFVSMDSFER